MVKRIPETTLSKGTEKPETLYDEDSVKKAETEPAVQRRVCRVIELRTIPNSDNPSNVRLVDQGKPLCRFCRFPGKARCPKECQHPPGQDF